MQAPRMNSDDLAVLLMNRGNNNKIQMSDPDWFDFPFIMQLLAKFETPMYWPYGVLLLNNVMAYEIGNNKNMFLVKQKKLTYLDNSVEGKTPCINHYSDEKHVRDMMKPYEFEVKRDEEDEEEPGPKRAKKAEKINWFKIWFASPYRATVHGVEFKVYNIAQSPTIIDSSISQLWEYKAEKDINYFTGYKWTMDDLKECAESPKGKEAIRRYLTYLFQCICDGNKEQYQFLLFTLAHFVQRPGVKTEYCVYVKGQKGIGKSLLLFTPFQLLFHQHTCYLAGQLLADDFNGRLKDGVLLVNLDEFPQTIKNMQAFKSQVTQSYMNVRGMFREAETVPNLMNFICTSNFPPSRAMEIGTDERRFLLISARTYDVTALEKHKKEINLFANEILTDCGLNTGFKAICYHLLTAVALPDGDLRMQIPMTPLMCRVIEESMPMMDRAVKKWIEQGGITAISRSETRKEYDWDNTDCAIEWTWKKLRMAALTTLNEDQVNVRTNQQKDIERLQQFMLTDETQRQGEKKGIIIQFRLMPRDKHFHHFRKFYPNVIYYWAHRDLIIAENPFLTAAQNNTYANHPIYQKVVSSTSEWTDHDYQVAFTQLISSLKTQGYTLELNPTAHTDSALFAQGSKSEDSPHVRVYNKEKELI